MLSCVWLFVTPWIAARQASLSITNSRSSPKLMSIESVMPSSHLILCYPLFLLPPIPPSIRVFSNESTVHIRWPKIGASVSASVLAMNIQGWFPLGLTSLIFSLSKGLSRVFSSTTVGKNELFDAQPFLWSNSYIHIWPRNAGLEEAQAGIKIAGRNINNRRYSDITLMAENEEELKSLLMKVKKESEKLA